MASICSPEVHRSAAAQITALLVFGACGSQASPAPSKGDGSGGEGPIAGFVSGGQQGEGGSSNGLVTECQLGQFQCNGSVAIPCENGGQDKERDCGAEGYECRAPNGCVVCTPGEGSCEGGQATVCNEKGTGLIEFVCDELQGMRCEPGGCAGACSPAQLQSGYVGCDYYPTVTVNPVFEGFEFAVAVANAGNEETQVEITRGEQAVASVTIPAGQLRTIPLPWVEELKGGASDSCQRPPTPLLTRKVVGGAYRLRSNRPVSVYQFNPLQYELTPAPAGCPLRDDCPGAPPRPDEGCLSFSNDATLLFPTNVFGDSYSVMSWPSTAAGEGFVSVVATRDGTRVQVTGRGRIAAGAGIDEQGVGSVTLDEGDVLQILSEAGSDQVFGSDLSGTVVTASAPIQVISGSSCAFVPEATTDACDHMEHAMLPEQTLGRDYLLSFPAAPASESPQVVRILPVVAGTTLNFEPPLPGIGASVVRSPEQGPLQITAVAIDFRVTADRPLLVVQYLQGRGSLDSGAGDPSMAVAVPRGQYRDNYIFSVSDTYDYNYINIVAPRSATVQLNGEVLPADEFVQIGSTDFGVQRLLLPKGVEVFRIEGSQPFGVVAYGYGKFTSYLYPAGLDLKKIAPPIIR